jgi:hypothetical protein
MPKKAPTRNQIYGLRPLLWAKYPETRPVASEKKIAVVMSGIIIDFSIYHSRKKSKLV